MPVWISNLLGSGIIDKILSFIPNPAEQAKAKLEMQSALLDAAIKSESDQRSINLEEAKSTNLFIAGWRPAVGWLCVAVLAYQWAAVPTMQWIVSLFHAAYPSVVIPPFPALGTVDTQMLLFALLGIGGFRTIDKGVAAMSGRKIK